MLASRGHVHIADLAADRSYTERNPPTVAAVELGGIRTTLAIPMMKSGQFIGSFTVGRTKVQPFTERQIEVLRLIGEGRTNLTIALELGLSEKTVKGHVAAIFKAMNVLNRTQAAAIARESGLI